jgi:hypothetical protein
VYDVVGRKDVVEVCRIGKQCGGERPAHDQKKSGAMLDESIHENSVIDGLTIGNLSM